MGAMRHFTPNEVSITITLQKYFKRFTQVKKNRFHFFDYYQQKRYIGLKLRQINLNYE